MTSLKFNPYYCLYTEADFTNGEEFFLQENNRVIVQLEFGELIRLPEDSHAEEALAGIDATFAVNLYPTGQEDQGFYLLSKVTKITENQAQTKSLRFSAADLQNVLMAVFKKEEQLPFESGQILSVPLIVDHVEKLRFPEGLRWIGRLLPHGKNVDGLIITEVQLASEDDGEVN